MRPPLTVLLSFVFAGFLAGLLAAGSVAREARDGEGKEARSTGLSALAWLAGTWVGEEGGIEMEEHWLVPKGGLMLGLHRDFRPAGGQVFFEYLRIAEGPEGVVYYASPGGRPPTAFPLVSATEGEALFENPTHDFPQRILYRLEDTGELVARIEGKSHGTPRSSEWRWKRSPSPPPR